MKSILIIGGGASGVLAAMQLLEHCADSHITILDPAPDLGIGIAYGTESLGHLLNVAAAGMSARPDAPDHFLNWLKAQTHWQPAEGVTPDSFAPRRIYRDYLRSLLEPWQDGAAAGRLTHLRVTVIDLRADDTGVELRGRDGFRQRADAAILATGNGAGPEAGEDGMGLWSSPTGFDLPTDAPVAILGTGLSMIDSVVSLLDAGHSGPITAVSRRGLVPRPHAAPEGPRPQPPSDHSLAGLARWFRAQRRASQDWRQAVDALRPVTQEIWAGWSLAEKRRFLRHARPWWDVHRHRMAPSIHTRIAAAEARGQLRIRAASLIRDDSASQGWLVIRPRGASGTEALAARHVIDCRGQAGGGSMAENPLLARLIATGQARPALARLGVEVDRASRVIDTHGQPAPRLFAIGPPTIGSFWEIVAIPDIRDQARDIARTLDKKG